MRIVVASGKGGTGKTLVATSLALVAGERAVGLSPAALTDADVEAPNAALFLAPTLDDSEPVLLQVPEVDPARCTHCGRCAEVCQYNAIASLPQQTLVFPELCHGCGSCAMNCSAGAIREVPRTIGIIDMGRAGGLAGPPLRFAEGTLEVGEAMATPVIRALRKTTDARGWARGAHLVVDAPPGTACPVIEALRDADVALLVTEPTPFGLHDLRMAVDVARDALGLPVAVVVNKQPAAADGGGDGRTEVDAYCEERGIPVLLRIPLRREIAVSYSRGEPLVQSHPEFREPFRALLDALESLPERAPAGHPEGRPA